MVEDASWGIRVGEGNGGGAGRVVHGNTVCSLGCGVGTPAYWLATAPPLAAQTTLRESIGAAMLAALLSDRAAADRHLRDEIGAKTEAWGIAVGSVEIRDVAIPVALQDAMSRQAKAGRAEKAGVTHGEAEAAIATSSYYGHVGGPSGCCRLHVRLW